MTTETQHTKTYNTLIRKYESVYNESMWHLNTVGYASEDHANHLSNIIKMAKKNLSASEYDDFVLFIIDLESW